MGKSVPGFAQQGRRKAIAVSRAVTKRRGGRKGGVQKFPSRRREDRAGLKALETKAIEEDLKAVQLKISKVSRKGKQPRQEDIELAAALKEDRIYVLYYPPNKRYVPLRHGMEGMEPDELEGLRKRMREMVKQDYVALTEIQEGMQQGTGTCAVEEELVLADNTTEAQRDEDTPRGKDAFFLYSSDDEEEETVMPMSLPVLPEESRELKHATPNAQGTSRPRPGKGRNTPHPGKGKSIPNSDRVHVAGSKSNRMPYNHSTHVARVESSITALPRRSRAEGGRKRRPKKR